MKNFIISIGRQLGSGGKEIAEKLGERLNIKVYDKTLLEVASKESGLDATVFETADEQENSGLFGGFFSIHGSMGEYMPMGGYMGNDKLFEIQSETIRNIADRENCIIVGRCAEYVLRDHPGMKKRSLTTKKLWSLWKKATNAVALTTITTQQHIGARHEVTTSVSTRQKWE